MSDSPPPTPSDQQAQDSEKPREFFEGFTCDACGSDKLGVAANVNLSPERLCLAFNLACKNCGVKSPPMLSVKEFPKIAVPNNGCGPRIIRA